MTAARRLKEPSICVRALRCRQGGPNLVFSLFLDGRDILRVADISRVSRDGAALKGFQRAEVKRHVREITEYLDTGPSLFPNAIILAISPDVTFKESRGPAPSGTSATVVAGTLTIPIREEGHRSAWIVDGQQRSLALAKSKNNELPVPVVAFVSDDIAVHREQFILVNKVKALPTGLIDELLPDVAIRLPRDLSVRQLPSALCNALNLSPASPFQGLIKREANAASETAVISDAAVMKMIGESLRNPLGVLAQHKRIGTADANAMIEALTTFWGAVKGAFPDAWGKPPAASRLMHAAGIISVGALMDQIFVRADGQPDIEKEIGDSLKRIAPHCQWLEGRWEELGLAWNEIQNTPQDIKKLTSWLTRLDRDLARGRK